MVQGKEKRKKVNKVRRLTKCGHNKQARKTERDHIHSHAEEPKTDIVGRLKIQQGITATHRLESQGQASSAGQKQSKSLQPLTDWRAKDRHC